MTKSAKRALRNKVRSHFRHNAVWLTNKLAAQKQTWIAEGSFEAVVQMEQAVKDMAATLRRMLTAGYRRAFTLHRLIDDTMADDKARDPATYERVQCKKGCDFCCYVHVGVSDDEADLLARVIADGEVEVDMAKLEEQAKWPSDKWAKEDPRKRGCVFLDSETRSCKVYAYRPAACRTYLVVTDPELCRIEIGGPPKNVSSVCSPSVEILASAACNIVVKDETHQSLPAKTLKRLKSLGKRVDPRGKLIDSEVHALTI